MDKPKPISELWFHDLWMPKYAFSVVLWNAYYEMLQSKHDFSEMEANEYSTSMILPPVLRPIMIFVGE